MTSHIYNTRKNALSTIEENVSSEVNFETSESFVISKKVNLIEMVQYRSPAQIFQEEKYSRSTIQMLSSVFSQIMILKRILEKMNKMTPYNQVTNHS